MSEEEWLWTMTTTTTTTWTIDGGGSEDDDSDDDDEWEKENLESLYRTLPNLSPGASFKLKLNIVNLLT